VEFNEVLLLDQDGIVNIGMPHVEGSKITGKILDHVRETKWLYSRRNVAKVSRKRAATVRISVKF